MSSKETIPIRETILFSILLTCATVITALNPKYTAEYFVFLGVLVGAIAGYATQQEVFQRLSRDAYLEGKNDRQDRENNDNLY